jgi:type VI secretion system secreted protein VgrG
MASPKSGTAGSPVPPTDATAACDADDADPGAVEAEKSFQRETQTGKYGTAQVKPFKPAAAPPADAASGSNTTTTSWIEIVLVDEQNNPIPGESYAITLPDNSVASGSLDEKGFARVEGFDPGQCQVTFPNLDQDAWTEK